jgi:hypothetical protein
LQRKLPLVTFSAFRERAEDFDVAAEMGNGFEIGRACHRTLAGAPPIGDGLLGEPCLGEMLSEDPMKCTL